MGGTIERLRASVCSRPVATTLLIGLPAAGWQVVAAPHDLGFDPDQAGNLMAALRFHDALGSGDILNTVAHSGRIAPLVPLLTLPFLAVRPHSSAAALLIEPVLYLATAALVAAVAARLSTRAAGCVAGLVCLGTPTAIVLARSYVLPLGTAACLTLAVLMLLRSDRGRRTGAMAAFGGAVGLMMLTRIVAAAFVPAVALACLVQVDRRNRVALRNVALSAGVALVIAAPWWWTNWDAIRSYVGSYGFGAEAQDLGPSNPVVRFLLLTVGGVFMHGRVLIGIALVTVVAVAARAAHRHPRPGLLTWVRTHREVVTVAVLVVGGFAALASSANMGSNFSFPLLMLAVATVTAVGAHLGGRAVRVATVIALVGALTNLVLVGRWDVGGDTDLEGADLAALLYSGVELPDHPTEWARAQRRVADAVASYAERRDVGRVVQTVVGGSQTFRSTSIEVTEALADLPVDGGPVSLEPGTPHRPRVLVVIRLDQSALGPGESPDDPTPTFRTALRQGWQVDRRLGLPRGSGDVLLLTHPDTLPQSDGPEAR